MILEAIFKGKSAIYILQLCGNKTLLCLRVATHYVVRRVIHYLVRRMVAWTRSGQQLGQKDAVLCWLDGERLKKEESRRRK